jgi:flagellin
MAMSSILTNTSAMVALQNLKAINMDLSKTQNEISTGKSISSASDNASMWAISKVMEADVAGFSAISKSLALGESTVAVAAAGADKIVEILKEMKEKIVTATGANVDHSKLSTDVTALSNQITSIIGAAQFNGMNLLSDAGSGTGTSLKVLSSLDRTSSAVTATSITVKSVEFTTDLAAAGTLSVANVSDANTALATIETLITAAIKGAADLGSSKGHIEDQQKFVSKLVDAMKSGIGALVDANMEEASARLQALQVQQQLGTQSLSIANKAPQMILQLFK